ncbi:MAG: ABC transporter substrate-binding protein [Dermatophilaceae bacterium]
MSYRRWATLAVIPVMVIAGCSGKADTPAPGAAGGSTGGSTGGSSWSAGQPTVKVGLISAMTGPFAVLGISQQNGMQVAVDRINAAGGVGGAKLEIVTRDMQLDPGKAVGFANELAGDPSVSFVVGPSITAFYNAAKGTFESNKKLNCQPAVAGGTFADTTYGFRMENSATQDVTRNLEYLQSKGLTKVGLVYEGDDTGKDYAKLMTDLGPKYGVTLVGFEQSRADDASHVAYVQSLMDKGAQAIWISNSGSGAKTMAAAEQAKFDGLMIGGSGAQNISFLEAAGDFASGAIFDAPEYQYPLRDKASWTPGYQAFVTAVEKEFGTNVGPKTGAKSPKGVAVAADCIDAFAAAANQAKSLDGTALATAFGSLDIPADKTASGCQIKPDKDHESYPLDCIRLYKWEKDAKGWFTTDITVTK